MLNKLPWWFNFDQMLTKCWPKRLWYSPINDKYANVTQNHVQNSRNADNCMRYFSHLQKCLTGHLSLIVTERKVVQKYFLKFVILDNLQKMIAPISQQMLPECWLKVEILKILIMKRIFHIYHVTISSEFINLNEATYTLKYVPQIRYSTVLI